MINGYKLCLIFIPGVVIFFLWYFNVFFGMRSTFEKAEYMRNVVLDIYEEDTFQIVFVALQYWEDDLNGKSHFRMIDFVCYLGFLLMIASCFLTIVFCAMKIYFKLKEDLNSMSVRTKELNRQLMMTLMFQVRFFRVLKRLLKIICRQFFHSSQCTAQLEQS